jgi:hypothetical protein
MAPLPDVPRVLKVSHRGFFNTAVAWAVHDYWRYSGVAPSTSDLNGFATAISAAYGAHLVSQFGDDTTMNQTEVIDLSSKTSAIGVDGTARPGTGGTLAVPDSICVLEKKTGSLRYRGGHARTYWPGLGSAGSMASGNAWGATQIQAFATALSAYLNAIIADGDSRPFGPIQRSIVHYKGKNPHLFYPFVEDVAASNTDTPFATQRRRLGR